MRIGLVIYGSLDTLSGGYLYDRKLVEYLRLQGDAVEIISLPWRNYAAHLTDNFWFRLWGPGACSWESQEQAPGPHKYDILIQDELNHPSLIVANQGKHPYPIISLVHHLRCSELRPGWQNTFYRVVEKKYLQSVDGFIFNSRTTQSAVNTIVESRKPNIVAYPPVDRFGEPISEEVITRRAQTNPLRILFLGNVIDRKGLHTLLNAISIQPSAFRVDVVGSLNSQPAYTRQIQKFIAQNDLASFIFLHGSLDKELLIDQLKQAHVLVVPSSYEGFGIVYLEGMCFGLPAIGTTAGAAGEIIENGQTGYLIKPNDSASLAVHLKSLAEDRGLLARLSINARKRYLRQPSWEATAESIRNFLYSVAK
ncbi:MAG TPA: glycosyltransferase family 4 protein [Anaerolineales bacterium]|nr:glycosyltransferase family 4 protein [Anaerolineales bacterium]HLO33865.1 glycosyltransferase family 4 protein [Anaerolineales bacterium]